MPLRVPLPSASRASGYLGAAAAGQTDLTDGQASFIKNRCQLRTLGEPDFDYIDFGIDERH